ncbi:hypothetical protein ACHQM5_012408 [Ranunculus cassubicifolius]
MEIKQDIVIVGAGIAGLATALALKRVGIQSLVLERSDVLRTTGAAITLFENAWVALDALGIGQDLASLYTPFEKGYTTDVQSGTVQELCFSRKNRDAAGPRAVHRSVLLEALVKELPVDSIRFSSKLRSIETLQLNDSTITILNLEDGTAIKAKVVIGCDGVHSVVGQWLGLADPIDSGRFAVRGLSVYPQGHGLKHEVNQILDCRTRTGFMPLNDKEVYWFAVYSKGEDLTRKSAEVIQKRILTNMAHLPPVFLDVVQHSDLPTLTCASLMFRAPWDLLLKDVYKDNVTVAGDAMHPMTSDLTQGGCSALEDAVVLGRHIGNSYILHGDVDSGALEGYVKERRWRAAMLISASYFSGWIQQGGTNWLKELIRDKLCYRFFSRLASIILNYDCGGLPSVFMTIEELKTKKSE